jgi:hypothetical protein
MSHHQVTRVFAAGAWVELEAHREADPPRRLSLHEARHRRGREPATVISNPGRRRGHGASPMLGHGSSVGGSGALVRSGWGCPASWTDGGSGGHGRSSNRISR